MIYNAGVVHNNGTLDDQIRTCPTVVSIVLCKPFMTY